MDVYREILYRRIKIIIIFLILCLILTLLNMITGPMKISLNEILINIVYTHNKTVHVVVWDCRLPWTLMAVMIGGALGLAGLEMQTILNNPLASPYTLGVSAGAGFGAAVAYVLGLRVLPAVPVEFIVPANAFFFAFLTCMLIMFIGRIRDFTSETLVLGGIAIAFLFHSMLALLEFFASEETLQAIVFWLFGSLTKATLLKSQVVFTVLTVVSILLLFRSWKITALRLGDEKAESLGINVKNLRIEILFYVSLLTSVAVCFTGIIAFVGLVAPHIARILIGEDHRFLIFGSILCGATVLSAGAIVSKVIIPGAIFPIGIITSMIGVPFFLFLVIRGRKQIW
jgi:iron complex transport system permease protein